MAPDPDLPVCAHCHDVIGVYEKCWLRDHDGSWRHANWRLIGSDRAYAERRSAVFHLECRAAAAAQA